MLFYLNTVLYLLRLNRIPITDYLGYSINPKTDTIKVFTRYRNFKVLCSKLDQLEGVLRDESNML